MDEVQKSVEKLKTEINNIKIVEFKDYGHFCHGQMETDHFPELLEESLN